MGLMGATRDLLDRLERHYIKPGEAMPGGLLVRECGVNGAFGASSRCDALYVGFTSASGRVLVGHELKVSRADWRHELDQPDKADFWADNCHAWYVVAPSTDVVPAEEIPAGWGLMVPNTRTKNRMQVVVKARAHHDRVPSWDAVRSIIARQDTMRRNDISDARRDALDKVDAQVAERVAARAEQAIDHKTRQRLDVLDEIERHLGVAVEHFWGDDSERVAPAEFARAVKAVRALERLTGYRGLDPLATSLERAADQVRTVVKELADLDEETA